MRSSPHPLWLFAHLSNPPQRAAYTTFSYFLHLLPKGAYVRLLPEIMVLCVNDIVRGLRFCSPSVIQEVFTKRGLHEALKLDPLLSLTHTVFVEKLDLLTEGGVVAVPWLSSLIMETVQARHPPISSKFASPFLSAPTLQAYLDHQELYLSHESLEVKIFALDDIKKVRHHTQYIPCDDGSSYPLSLLLSPIAIHPSMLVYPVVSSQSSYSSWSVATPSCTLSSCPRRPIPFSRHHRRRHLLRRPLSIFPCLRPKCSPRSCRFSWPAAAIQTYRRG